MPTVPRGVRRPGTLCVGLVAGPGCIDGFPGKCGGTPDEPRWKLKLPGGFIATTLVSFSVKDKRRISTNDNCATDAWSPFFEKFWRRLIDGALSLCFHSEKRKICQKDLDKHDTFSKHSLYKFERAKIPIINYLFIRKKWEFNEFPKLFNLFFTQIAVIPVGKNVEQHSQKNHILCTHHRQ